MPKKNEVLGEHRDDELIPDFAGITAIPRLDTREIVRSPHVLGSFWQLRKGVAIWEAATEKIEIVVLLFIREEQDGIKELGESYRKVCVYQEIISMEKPLHDSKWWLAWPLRFQHFVDG